MKKLLLASTALVGFAGAAAAEVSISGSAEIGIADDSVVTLFFQSVDVRFAMTGETDSGLSFGATIDLEDALDSAAPNWDSAAPNYDIQSVFGSFADYTVFVSGAFGKLTMGDTDGGFDWAMTEVGMGAAIADDHTGHTGYNGNSGHDGTYNGQVARYEYSFGSFGFAASLELDGVNDPVVGLGVKYATDLGGTKLSFGLGYQATDNTRDVIGASAKAELAGGFSGVLNYSKRSLNSVTYEHTAIGLGYETGALLVSANYGMYVVTPGLDAEGYGLAVNYDLGGGAVVQVGYGSSDLTNVDTFSVGLALSF